MINAVRLCLVAGGLVLAAAMPAAAVNVTDCTAANPNIQLVNKKTTINLPGDPVVIQCPLMALAGGNGQVQVIGQSITVDGPAGGSVTSSGKGPQATLLQASGAVTIDAANVIAANGNGNVVVNAGGNVGVTAGSNVQAGDRVIFTCTGAACTIDITGSTVAANMIEITAQGNVTVSPTSNIQTSSPRDKITITSLTGNVVIAGGAAGGASTVCCESVLQACQPDPTAPSCPLSQGPITLTTFSDVMSFCALCLQTGSTIRADVEGDIIINAPLGFIDVSGTTLAAGEGIVMTALLRIDADNASISNCGPKDGVVVLTVTGGGNCEIASATILDDDPETQPTLNCTLVGTPTLLGTCSSKP